MARARRLIWTSPALDDLDEIVSYIALDDPRAAGRVAKKAMAAVERLRRHPTSGRRIPELQTDLYREVIVPPCRIVYRAEGKDVLIVYVTRAERRLRLDRLP